MCQAKVFVDSMADALRGVEQMHQTYSRLLSDIDHEINVIYHEIEQTRFNACDGYKMVRRLQEKLRDRRVIKTELSAFQSVFRRMHDVKLDSRLKRLAGQIDKTEQSFEAYTAVW